MQQWEPNVGIEPRAQARTLLRDPNETAVIAITDVSFMLPIIPVQYRDCLVFDEHLVSCFKVMGATIPVPLTIPQVWYDQPI
jgi:hypothetical protein